jgi:hypothetical protein
MGANIEDLRVEARYWRERADLYRAKAYGPRPTTPARLRELERAASAAEARLRAAEAAQRAATSDDHLPE